MFYCMFYCIFDVSLLKQYIYLFVIIIIIVRLWPSKKVYFYFMSFRISSYSQTTQSNCLKVPQKGIEENMLRTFQIQKIFLANIQIIWTLDAWIARNGPLDYFCCANINYCKFNFPNR
jgi:hypothetical protein